MSMGFKPTFTITNRITAGLTRIERAWGFLEAATLSEAWVREMGRRALILEAHHTTHIEGTRLTLEHEQAERLLAGNPVPEAKQIEKDIDRQEQFVSELRDFKDKLRRTANRHLEPDLNDGVFLNIAPLWELAPWKEAKEYWEELVEGKYEWSGIGKQLHEKGLVRRRLSKIP